MAVLSECPGLEVTVMLDNQPLQEYDDDSEDIPQSRTTTKYIEARSGAKFAVSFSFKRQFPVTHGVEVRLSIDGKVMSVDCFYAAELYKYTQQCNSTQMKQNGEWVEQKFSFSKLDIVEEASMSRPDIKALRRDLGTKGRITLEFWFAKDIHECVRQGESKPIQLTALDRIPEKALKGNALSHQTTLTKPQRSRRQHARIVRFSNFVDKEPFATFHFKYRSLASLQALRVVKVKENISVPLEERPEDELSPEELRELVRRMRQRSATIKPDPEVPAQIKRKKPTYDDDEVAVVESRPCKRARTDAETIVID